MVKEIITWETLQTHKGEIICFGAGMVFLHIEHLLAATGILGKISAVADNDSAKWGQIINYGRRNYKILSLQELGKISWINPLILISCEKDEEVIEQLNKNDFFDKWKVASYPKLNRFYRAKLKAVVPKKEKEYCIPKIIHSIWFGKKIIPEIQQNYMEGWKRLCPDYEFRLWDESNYDVSQYNYTREAYKSGDYARVSDYVRMDILYRYGGFYMDTDVELIKNLDILRRHLAVFAYGEWPVVNSGIICGTVPGNDLIACIRDIPRSQSHYYDSVGKPDKKTNCYYENEIFKTAGFKGDFTSQIIKGIAVYSPVYFASEGRYFSQKEITEKTIAVHHCAGSWKRGDNCAKSLFCTKIKPDK